jgi:hypothetical protein
MHACSRPRNNISLLLHIILTIKHVESDDPPTCTFRATFASRQPAQKRSQIMIK